MNMPTTIRITFIRKKITYLLVEMDIIPLEIAAGIPEYAITKDMAEEAEIRNRMMPLVQALLTKIFMKRFYSNAAVADRKDQAVKHTDTCTFCSSKDTSYNTTDNNDNKKQTWDSFQCYFKSFLHRCLSRGRIFMLFGINKSYDHGTNSHEDTGI